MPRFLAPVGVIGPAANGHLTVGTNTTTAAEGLWFGTDTNLHRLDVDTLSTSGDFVVGGTSLTADGYDVIAPAKALEGTAEPSGFEDRTESTVSLVDNGADYTFTIAPTGASFVVWVAGTRTTKTAENLTIAKTTGSKFIYYDSAGNLTQSASPWDLFTDTPIVLVYYSATADSAIMCEERHGCVMDSSTHNYLHTTRGASYANGLNLADYVVQPSSPVDADNRWSISGGKIMDEDLIHTITAVAAGGPYSVIRRVGATEWTATVENDPYITTGGTIAYNSESGGSWGQTAVPVNNYCNYWVFAWGTLDAANQVFVMQGQSAHSTLADAQAATIAGDLDISLYPFVESVARYQVTFRRGAAYTTTGGCRIAAVTQLFGTNLVVGSQVSASNHATLINRELADQHPASAITNTPAGDIVSTDTQSAVNELDTKKAALSGAALTGTYAFTLPATTTDAITSRVTGDAAARFVHNTDGSLEWGDGFSATDTFLSRSAVGRLYTPGAFRTLKLGVNADPYGDTANVGANAYVRMDATEASGIGASGLRLFTTLTPTTTTSATVGSLYSLYYVDVGAGFTLTSSDSGVSGLKSHIRKQGAGNVTGNLVAIGGPYHLFEDGNVASFMNLYAPDLRDPGVGGTPTVTTAYGLYVAGQKASFVTTGYGIYQAGTSDLNVFKGATTFDAATTHNASVTLSSTNTLNLASSTYSLGYNTGFLDIRTNTTGALLQTSSMTAGPTGGGLHLVGGGYNNLANKGGMYAGVTSDTGTFTARATSASGIALNAGKVYFYGDDGLTAGNAYTPTLRAMIDADGTFNVYNQLTLNDDLYVTGHLSVGAVPVTSRSAYIYRNMYDADIAANYSTMGAIGVLLPTVSASTYSGVFNSKLDVRPPAGVTVTQVDASLYSVSARCVKQGDGNVNSMQAITTGYHELYGEGTLTELNNITINNTRRISGNGTIGTVRGLNIANQAAAHVTTTYGIYQAGTSDLNYFGGPIVAGASAATTGQIRLPYNNAIYWRNSLNTADDAWVNSGASGLATLNGPTYSSLSVGGTSRLTVSATNVTLNTPTLMLGSTTSYINTNASLQWGITPSDTYVNIFGGTVGAAVNLESSLPIDATSIGKRIGGITFTSTVAQADAHRQVSGMVSRVTGYSGTYTLYADLGFYVKAGAAAQEVLTLNTSSATFAGNAYVQGTVLSVGTTTAQSGTIRLANNSSVTARNSTNDGDRPLVNLSSTNILQLGSGTSTLDIGAGPIATFSLTGGANLAIGTNPATTGRIRLPNNGPIYWRNAANSGDTGWVNYGTSDNIVLNGGASSALSVAGSAKLTVTAATSLVSIANGYSLAIGDTTATAGAIRLPNATNISWRNNLNTANDGYLNYSASSYMLCGAGAGFDFAVAGASTLSVYGNRVTLRDGKNVELDSTTGSKFGTATTQKMGWWNATPVVQNTGWSVTGGYTSDKTFDPESGTLTEALRVLGTLIDTLKTYGFLGG